MKQEPLGRLVLIILGCLGLISMVGVIWLVSRIPTVTDTASASTFVAAIAPISGMAGACIGAISTFLVKTSASGPLDPPPGGGTSILKTEVSSTSDQP